MKTMERQHYSKAPIVEAVIELRCKSNNHIPINELEKIGNMVRRDYSVVENIDNHQLQMEVGTGKNPKHSSQLVGYRFFHKERKYMFQVKLDGFSCSVLQPYDCWEAFVGEAQRLWGMYRAIAAPQLVTRTGVRYINRINIPYPAKGDLVEPSDYFSTYPHISDKFRYPDVANFAMRLLFPQPDLLAHLSLIQTRVAPESEKDPTISIVLDIDIFSERITDPWMVADDASLWDFFGKLHARKNETFEACITDRTRELIR